MWGGEGGGLSRTAPHPHAVPDPAPRVGASSLPAPSYGPFCALPMPLRALRPAWSSALTRVLVCWVDLCSRGTDKWVSQPTGDNAPYAWVDPAMKMVFLPSTSATEAALYEACAPCHTCGLAAPLVCAASAEAHKKYPRRPVLCAPQCCPSATDIERPTPHHRQHAPRPRGTVPPSGL